MEAKSFVIQVFYDLFQPLSFLVDQENKEAVVNATVRGESVLFTTMYKETIVLGKELPKFIGIQEISSDQLEEMRRREEATKIAIKAQKAAYAEQVATDVNTPICGNSGSVNPLRAHGRLW